jgi:hypothetical protein
MASGVIPGTVVGAIRRNKSFSARRITFALLVTPLLAPFYAAILFGHPWVLPIGLMLSYPSALLIGAPTLVLLIRNRWAGWCQCAAAGMLCSVPAIALYSRWSELPQVDPFSAGNAATLLAWGAFSGLCFWLLGISGDSPVTIRTILTGGLRY